MPREGPPRVEPIERSDGHIQGYHVGSNGDDGPSPEAAARAKGTGTGLREEASDSSGNAMPVLSTSLAFSTEQRAVQVMTDIDDHLGGQGVELEEISLRAEQVAADAQRLSDRASKFGHQDGIFQGDVRKIQSDVREVQFYAKEITQSIEDGVPPPSELGEGLARASERLSDSVQESYGTTHDEVVESVVGELREASSGLDASTPVMKGKNFGAFVDVGYQSNRLLAVAQTVLRQTGQKRGAGGIRHAAEGLHLAASKVQSALSDPERRDRNFYEPNSTPEVFRLAGDAADRGDDLRSALFSASLPRGWRNGSEVTNVLDGDRVTVTQGGGSEVSGTVVGVKEPGPDDPGPPGTQYLILADFGGPDPGRIPVVAGRLPNDVRHTPQG